MNKNIQLITFLVFSLVFQNAVAQPYSMRSLQVEDGLSQNMVYCVFQDRHDFMWIGTQDGLNQYDGSSFRIYKKGNDSGLLNDAIFALAQDSMGNLWVGTQIGLHIYNPLKESFSYVPLLGSSGEAIEGIVRDIEFTADGSAFVVVADSCIVHISSDLRQEQLTISGIGSNFRIRDILPDDNGNLWVASYRGGLSVVPLNNSKTAAPIAASHFGLGSSSTPLSHGNGSSSIINYSFGSNADKLFTKVISKDNETLLVGTVDNGLLEFDLRSREFRTIKGMDNKFVHFVHDILIDSKGKIWVGSENGLHISDGGNITRLSHMRGRPDSISDNAVFCINEDRDGGIWIGTYFGGVNYYSYYSSQFNKFYPDPGSNKLKGKNISEFCEAPGGKLWVGTEDAGLHRFDPRTSEFESGFLPASNIHALCRIKDKVLVGTYSDGLFVLDDNGRTYRHYMLSEVGGTPGDNSIYSILQDLSGIIWIGTETGLFTYNIGTRAFSRVSEDLIYRQVNDIVQAFDGDLWFATIGQGIFCYSPSNGSWQNITDVDSHITCILEDSHHDLWFGTEDSGICYYNHRTERFERRWTEADGLPNNMVYKLMEDENGSIWGSTNHGLFLLNPSRDNVLHFDYRSGLVGDQFNYKSGYKTNDGRFYFGGVKGFVSFSPAEFVIPAWKSKIVFNRFLLFNSDTKPGSKDSPLQKAILFEKEITLSPRQSMFSIGFADLNYCSSDIKTYQYRLVGHDSDWINIERTHLLSFSNLSPGHYRLEVRANPVNSFPGDTIKTLDINILPPWFKTPLAITFGIMALLALILIPVYRILKRIVERNREAVIKEFESRRAASSADAKFLENIKKAIESNLSNPEFNVNSMGDVLHMSRSTLYRKMKLITGLSGNDYIKQCRLQKAAKMLAEKTCPVSEVSVQTGFNSVSYFSRCFREQYGVSPKDYIAPKE